MKTCFLFIILLFVLIACSVTQSEPEELSPKELPLSVIDSINDQMITEFTIFKKCWIEGDSLRIEYTLTEKDSVSIKIYNPSGVLVEVLVDENAVDIGDYSEACNLKALKDPKDLKTRPGFYFCKMKNGKVQEVKKVLLKK
jgi:hypothetical protein